LRVDIEKKDKLYQDLVTQQALKIARLENQFSSLQGAVQEVQEFQKGMKHFKKGGLSYLS